MAPTQRSVKAFKFGPLGGRANGRMLKCGSGFEGRRSGGGQLVKRTERQVEELTEETQAPCSHSVRCLRCPHLAADGLSGCDSRPSKLILFGEASLRRALPTGALGSRGATRHIYSRHRGVGIDPLWGEVLASHRRILWNIVTKKETSRQGQSAAVPCFRCLRPVH